MATLTKDSLPCPNCEGTENYVVDSRPGGINKMYDTTRYRRRKCESCKNTFTTHEVRLYDIHKHNEEFNLILEAIQAFGKVVALGSKLLNIQPRPLPKFGVKKDTKLRNNNP